MQNWGPVRFPDYSVGQFAQPKQRFSFIVLYQLPLGFAQLNQVSQLSGNREPYPAISSVNENNINSYSSLLTMATKNFPALNWGVTPQTDSHFFNGQLHWAGKREYTPNISITFREYVTNPVSRILLSWQKLQNDPVTNNIGYANKYKGIIVKLDMDPNVFHDGMEMLDIQELLKKVKSDTQTGLGGKPNQDLDKIITRGIVCEGVWPTSIAEPDGDYADQGMLQDTVQTFQCDRYYEDKDWQRFIDNPGMKIGALVTGSSIAPGGE